METDHNHLVERLMIQERGEELKGLKSLLGEKGGGPRHQWGAWPWEQTGHSRQWNERQVGAECWWIWVKEHIDVSGVLLVSR